jgi:peptidyl-prolyl cis-trans isomerase A (cyclophilin A)
MKSIKKLAVASFSLALVLTLAACGSNKQSSSTASSTEESTTASTISEKELNAEYLPQLEDKVTDKEYLVRIETTEGNIEMKLFPEFAPLAVENFVTHAKEGYYNNVTFHRVVPGFMIQGGDPQGNGTGGKSIWNGKDKKIDSGNGFKNETSYHLYNLNGAVSMANAGPDTNGSQFFINQNTDVQSDGLLKSDYPEKIIEAYKKGGNPTLDWNNTASPVNPHSYTIFGQVTSGMDVVKKIADAPTKKDGAENSTPENPVKMTKIDILQEPKK